MVRLFLVASGEFDDLIPGGEQAAGLLEQPGVVVFTCLGDVFRQVVHRATVLKDMQVCSDHSIGVPPISLDRQSGAFGVR